MVFADEKIGIGMGRYERLVVLLLFRPLTFLMFYLMDG